MFFGLGRDIRWGCRSWCNVCSGPIFGVDTVCERLPDTWAALHSIEGDDLCGIPPVSAGGVEGVVGGAVVSVVESTD